MARRRVTDTEHPSALTVPRQLLPLLTLSVPDAIGRHHDLLAWFDAHRVPPSQRQQMMRTAKAAYGIEEPDPRILLKRRLEQERTP